MSEYLTEEEQVERLKQWWKENGRSIIVGVVVGLSIFGGWQGWQGYRMDKAESGAVAFDVFSQQARELDVEALMTAESGLKDAYAGTAYADFAALEVARKLAEDGRLEEAAARLRAVREGSVTQGIRELARIRLARVLMATEALDEASSVLAGEAPQAFAGEIAALRGDVARMKNDSAAARAAYEQAQAQGGGEREWVDLALQNIGGDKEG